MNKKVSDKRVSISQYKWIKQLYCEIDEIKKRLDNLEGKEVGSKSKEVK